MMNEKTILIAIGTNAHRSKNMKKARMLLDGHIKDIRFTKSMNTEAIGIHAKDFLNCLASGTTTDSFEEVNDWLKDIERQCGNTAEKRQEGLIEMDLDILEYAGDRYHEKDWQREYIVKLYKELNNEENSIAHRSIHADDGSECSAI
ncbi:MAG: 2-amino-4-hydroxy-6-hydroxymethyldihydropteridine diphosphokinase [Prevotella sp.]|nr:2-amino-4-hydroxy-6-hydroxymethyldihydropteridine diphosphokinase [Prevotella sp.]